jgi:hypothetical protein
MTPYEELNTIIEQAIPFLEKDCRIIRGKKEQQRVMTKLLLIQWAKKNAPLLLTERVNDLNGTQ